MKNLNGWLALMWLVIFCLVGIGIGMTIHPAWSKNYDQVICDDEPDPLQCGKIRTWYQGVKMPIGSGDTSCCGEGDAYWIDDIDRITDKGVWATVTDDRPVNNRIPRNGQKVFIPTEKLDNRFQGNPTGHNVVFLGQGFIYPNGTDQPGTPYVYCAFLNFAG